MLKTLHIQNLLYIDHSVIEFAPGLNILTGESGHGKSMIIRAISFLCGSKLDVSQIRPGTNEIRVSAEFFFPQKIASSITQKPLSELVIEKILHSDGKTLLLANGKKLLRLEEKLWVQELVRIISQGTSQKLYAETEHTNILNQFIERKLLHTVSQTATALQTLKKEIFHTFDEYQKLTATTVFLEKIYQDIKALSPSALDYEETLKQAKDGEKSYLLGESLTRIKSAFENFSENGLLTDFSSAVKFIKNRDFELGNQLEEKKSLFSSLILEIEDLVESNLQATQEKIENFEHSQKRLAAYQSLIRKTGKHSAEELFEYTKDVENKLNQVTILQASLQDKINKASTFFKTYKEACYALSTERKTKGQNIEKRISEAMQDLGLETFSFYVSFKSHLAAKEDTSLLEIAHQFGLRFSADQEIFVHKEGLEKIQFRIKTSGQQKSDMPLNKVISGGEASRILLAIETALSQHSSYQTIIMDEIDAGLSGRLADRLGKKLKSLALQKQLIVVSHSPQVILYADRHIKISKFIDQKNDLHLTAKELNEKERLEELAQLISSEKVTKSGILHAEALLKAKTRQHGNILI